MGSKRKNRRKAKQNKAFQPIPPLDNEKREMLQIEAISAHQLLTISKEQLSKGQEKTAYLLSRHWFDSWKIYVGYEAFIKNDKPTGRKFGRTQMEKINNDIIRPADDFHYVKEQYQYLLPPIKEDLKPQRDYLLVNEDVWKFLQQRYDGFEIKRMMDDQGQFQFSFLQPKVIYITKNIMQSIQEVPQNQVTNKRSLLNNLKIIVPAQWDFNELQIYFRNHLSTYDLNVWLLDQGTEVSQHELIILKSIHSERFILKGYQLQSQLQINRLIKSSYVLLVDPFNLFSAVESEFQLKSQGMCFYCNQKSSLSIQCACKKAFYCTDACRYKDQEFHSNICEKAFDSEDDDEMDQINQLEPPGVGLVNLGNTCYMNASLQCLFSSENLVQFMLKKLYITQNCQKKQIQLNYKIDKLIKHLYISGSKFTPYSFRQQLAKRYPEFGNNNQQDAAEFILYLFDALNEEIMSLNKKDQQNQQQQIEEVLNFDIEDNNTESKQEDSDDDDEEDGHQMEEELDKEEMKQQKQLLLHYQRKQDNQAKTCNQAWENALKQYSPLLIENFVGQFKSTIKCPVCQSETDTFETFHILPLSIDTVQCAQSKVDIFVVFYDWLEGFVKLSIPFDVDNFMVAEVKQQVGQQINIDPEYLIAAMCTPHEVKSIILQDEEKFSKVLQDNKNLIFVLYQLNRKAHEVTDDDLYMDVQYISMEKRTVYSSVSEAIPTTFPRLIIINKFSPSQHIYQIIFDQLKDHARGCDNLILPENPIPEDLFTTQQLKEVLGFSVKINFKFASRTKCPFACGKLHKKDTQHKCDLPFNNKKEMATYLDCTHLRDPHSSLIIEFEEGKCPQKLRIVFDWNQQQRKEPALHLNELINQFQSEEGLFDENAYYCQSCKDLTFAMKKIQICFLPNQLIIQLKRFQYSEFKGAFTKNNKLIDYPEVLEVNNTLFRLYGIVDHSGSLENGHYIAYGKRDGWYEFNDDKVSKLKSIDDVLGNKDAYLLFYQQI